MNTKRFPLGQLVATPGALALAESHAIDILSLVRRHASGDWGDLDSEDISANNRALISGARLFSAYGKGDTKLYIITEADRSVTTVLLPEDY